MCIFTPVRKDETKARQEELNKMKADAEEMHAARVSRNQAFEEQRAHAAKTAERQERESRERHEKWKQAQEARVEVISLSLLCRIT